MKQIEEKEYLIRGRIIYISSTIESLIARLIILVNINNPDKDDNIPFKKMNYTAKLLKLIKLFKTYYFQVYHESLDTFNKLESITDFRNKMAHCIFQWNDPSLLSFEVVEAEIDVEGIHHFTTTKYTIQDCFDKIDQFKEAAISLLKLVIKIEEDLNQKMPGFIDLIRPARNNFSKE